MRRIDRWKALWSIALVSFFAGAVVSVFTGDEIGTAGAAESQAKPEGGEGQSHGAAHEAEVKEPVIEKTAEGCLADSATLEDLKRQRREIELRQKELAAREAELKQREQALADEIRKLADARDEIGKLDSARKKESEAKVAKLVETIENMNPKSAASLVASLDETLAVQAMTRLSTAKLAKMMNVMDPQRSTKLSELLAGVTRAKRSRSASNEDAAAVTAERSLSPAKGGEKNDGKSHEQASNRSTGDGVDSGAARRQPASAAGQKGQDRQ